MCKHAAAVLYGVGSRLDDRPGLLFRLRDVDGEDLVVGDMALPDAAAGDDVLAGGDGPVFRRERCGFVSTCSRRLNSQAPPEVRCDSNPHEWGVLTAV